VGSSDVSGGAVSTGLLVSEGVGVGVSVGAGGA